MPPHLFGGLSFQGHPGAPWVHRHKPNPWFCGCCGGTRPTCPGCPFSCPRTGPGAPPHLLGGGGTFVPWGTWGQTHTDRHGHSCPCKPNVVLAVCGGGTLREGPERSKTQRFTCFLIDVPPGPPEVAGSQACEEALSRPHTRFRNARKLYAVSTRKAKNARKLHAVRTCCC